MKPHKILVLWRGNPSLGPSHAQSAIRYPDVLSALRDVGFDVRYVVYLDSESEAARSALSEAHAILVWADPVSADGDRTLLDQVLREVSENQVHVFTHPDTIQLMGTKDVLFDTRSLSWSQDTQRYESFSDFVAQFPITLSGGHPRVLKQHRGNGGIGVWKVELVKSDPIDVNASTVRVQHAAPRDGQYEDITLAQLWERMRIYFEDSGHLIDQAFAERVSEGMVRVYVVKREVVGFARQYADQGDGEREPVPADRVFGIPAAKTMLDAEEPEFATLRQSLEVEWIPEMQELLGVTDDQLPLLWDADFLFGPKVGAGCNTFVLCEINVSCVSPFPPDAPARMASQLLRALGESV